MPEPTHYERAEYLLKVADCNDNSSYRREIAHRSALIHAQLAVADELRLLRNPATTGRVGPR